MMSNGYQQYKDQSVNTMTKGEMLNLLYEEAIKRLKRAKLSFSKNELEAFDYEVGRVREIITYLATTLNRKYHISNNLAQLYEYMNFELSRAKAGRKQEPIDEVLSFMVELRDSFKEADKKCKQTNSAHTMGSVHLGG